MIKIRMTSWEIKRFVKFPYLISGLRECFIKSRILTRKSALPTRIIYVLSKLLIKSYMEISIYED